MSSVCLFWTICYEFFKTQFSTGCDDKSSIAGKSYWLISVVYQDLCPVQMMIASAEGGNEADS